MAGLRDGMSAFTPGAHIWSAAAADELDRCYVKRLDLGSGTFVEKLKGQLHDAEPPAVQLAAELLYLNALPLANVSGTAKRARIGAVLSWLPQAPSLPANLDAALDVGVFSGGVGFNTMLWSQLVHLVAFVQQWWREDQGARDDALRDPWAWKAFVESVAGGNAPSQRNALKYLAFPDTFQPIVNVEHRQRIRKAFVGLLGKGPTDIDRDLLTIREKLQAESPEQPVDFYAQPWVKAWKTGDKATVGRHAWLVRPPTGAAPGFGQRWLADGFVSVAADSLRVLEPGVTLQAVRDAVGHDYGAVEYVRQMELADGFHTFLSVMVDDDVVATVFGDVMHLGTLDKEPPWFDDSEVEGRLRRQVTWRTSSDPIPVADLPAPLPTHLATQGLVVDLSEDLELLLALVDAEGEGDSGVGDASGVDLVMAGEQPPLRPATAELADRLHVDRAFLQEWIDLLTDRQQVIFYGPPGTGKTFLAERVARFLADAGALESDRVALVQFHPSTSYEDFVEGYRPAAGKGDGTVSFELTPGPLSRLVAAARRDPSRPYFLLIDEINRANLAKVFGELYYLLEYRDSGIQLLYRPGKPFTLPRNVFLIGTMNTADRSIALVDAAMRRRFAFVELHPDDEPVKGMLRRWLGKRDSLRADLLEALNSRVEDRDFKIGPSYVMKADAEREGGLERVWKYSILPLLVEHHFGRLSPAQVENKYGLKALKVDLGTAPKSEEGTPVDEAYGTSTTASTEPWS